MVVTRGGYTDLGTAIGRICIDLGPLGSHLPLRTDRGPHGLREARAAFGEASQLVYDVARPVLPRPHDAVWRRARAVEPQGVQDLVARHLAGLSARTNEHVAIRRKVRERRRGRHGGRGREAHRIIDELAERLRLEPA